MQIEFTTSFLVITNLGNIETTVLLIVIAGYSVVDEQLLKSTVITKLKEIFSMKYPKTRLSFIHFALSASDIK
jgi:hypothetical protein